MDVIFTSRLSGAAANTTCVLGEPHPMYLIISAGMATRYVPLAVGGLIFLTYSITCMATGDLKDSKCIDKSVT